MTSPRFRWVWAALLLVVAACSAPAAGEAPNGKPEKTKLVPTSEYVTRTVEGWTVHVNRRLLGEQADLGARALRLLEVKLFDVRRVVPPAAFSALQKVPIWLGVDDGPGPCMEYHPSKEWLANNGWNPDKAKCVEIGNAGRFLQWSLDQPMMVLHELSHAYHDQVLGFNHPGIQAAYRRAVESGTYNSVMHYNGKPQKAYALTDPQEYFAEASEAYFGQNDFYPFVRAELEKHDPQMAALVREVWYR